MPENEANLEYQNLVSELEALDSQIESYETSLKDTEERYAQNFKSL